MSPDSLASVYDSGLPAAQVFLIFNTDKDYQETIEIETQKDSFGDWVVFWTDIMHLHKNAIYLKDNNGMVATFVQNDSRETRLPLRVLYSRDPLTIIVHKAPPGQSTALLSKGLRIEPERTLSASTRVRKILHRAFFRTNSVPVTPMDSTGAHYYHQTTVIVTETPGDSQLVKIPESLNRTMPLPTTHAPLPPTSQMSSTMLLKAQKASGTTQVYPTLPLASSTMTTSVMDPRSLTPPLPDRVQALLPRANTGPASVAPFKLELEDDSQEQHEPQRQQQQEQQPITTSVTFIGNPGVGKSAILNPLGGNLPLLARSPLSGGTTPVVPPLSSSTTATITPFGTRYLHNYIEVKTTV
ncbi:MAG: hypothetical protein J3R72DRAFT_424420 [Linnemannia gamsii]|nr:MAG: hypothetical protein J3R72DRAFT_424420 [Linnemannia gamsii]